MLLTIEYFYQGCRTVQACTSYKTAGQKIKNG